MRAAIFVPALVLALSGCSLVVSDLNNYTTSEAACLPGESNAVRRDLEVALSGVAPHVSHRFELAVVRHSDVASERQLAARIVLDPLEEPSVAVLLPQAVPPGNYDLEFYADLNGNGMPDAPPADHSWVRPINCDGSVMFSHVFEFEPVGSEIPIGEDFSYHLQNVPAAYDGQPLEVQLVLDENGNGSVDDTEPTIGMYRLGSIPGSDVTVGLEGVVDVGNTFVVQAYVDLDGDRLPGASDVVCETTATHSGSPGAALTVELDLTAELAGGDCQAP